MRILFTFGSYQIASTKYSPKQESSNQSAALYSEINDPVHEQTVDSFRYTLSTANHLKSFYSALLTKG